MLQFKQKKFQYELGFTLIEVIVAILILTAFITVGMQLLVSSVAFKVSAREKAVVTAWIEEDLESVKFRASQYIDSSRCSPGTIIAAGYAQGFRDAAVAANGLGGSFTPANKIIFGENFQLIRIANPRSAVPYNILEIQYSVTSASGVTIATINTEIIPDAALQCP
jgi:prepilin-type N-terminal cleavage/methylation domain-containing protein